MTPVSSAMPVRRFSGEWLAIWIKKIGADIATIAAAFIPTAGLISLVVLDVIVGGAVLVIAFAPDAASWETVAFFGWSSATSAATWLLWSLVFARRWHSLVTILFAVLVTLLDTYIDTQIVVYLANDRNREVLTQGEWAWPQLSPLATASAVLVALLTAAGDVCSAVLRRLLVRTMSTEAS